MPVNGRGAGTTGLAVATAAGGVAEAAVGIAAMGALCAGVGVGAAAGDGTLAPSCSGIRSGSCSLRMEVGGVGSLGFALIVPEVATVLLGSCVAAAAAAGTDECSGSGASARGATGIAADATGDAGVRFSGVPVAGAEAITGAGTVSARA